MRWTSILALVALGIASASSRTLAASPLELTWNAPAACPASAAVYHDVESSLSPTPAHRVVARADVTELAADRWSVRLTTEVDGVPGERSLEADSCASLASATALILAWTVDPAAAARRGDARESPLAPPPDVAAPPPANAREPFRGLVAASGRMDSGLLPAAAAGADMTLGVSRGPVRAEVMGAYWFPQDATGMIGGTRIQLWEGALRACVRALGAAKFEVWPCAGAGIVHASSEGFGLQPSYQVSRDWGTVGGDVAGSWAMIGPFVLRASVGFVAPLARPAFVLLDPKGEELPLHRAAAVSLRASLGAGVRFP